MTHLVLGKRSQTLTILGKNSRAWKGFTTEASSGAQRIYFGVYESPGSLAI